MEESNNISEEVKEICWAKVSTEGEVLREDDTETSYTFIPLKEIEELSKEDLKNLVNNDQRIGNQLNRNRTDNEEKINLRYDSVESISPTIKEGRLIATGVFARAGVQVYRDKDGSIVREFRPPSEIRKATSEYANLPISLEHPQVFIGAKNIEKYIVGLTGESWFKNDLVKGKTTLFNQDAIKASQLTHQQFSHGYTCTIEYKSGVWTDKYGVQGPAGKNYKYDRIQRNIKGNHLALVSRARAGEIATFDNDTFERFRDDNTQEIEVLTALKTDFYTYNDMENNKDQEMVTMDMGEGKMEVPKTVKDFYDRGDIMLKKDMEKVTYDEETYYMPKKAADAFSKMKKDMGAAHSKKDSQDGEIGDLQTRLDTSRKERKDLEIKCDTLEAKITQLNGQIEELENNPRLDEDLLRQELEMRNDAYNRSLKLTGEVEFDASKTSSDWKKEAIKALTPSVKVDGLTDEEIDARFDTLEQVFDGDNAFSRQIKKAGAELSNAVQSMNNPQDDYTPVLPQDRPLKFTK